MEDNTQQVTRTATHQSQVREGVSCRAVRGGGTLPAARRRIFYGQDNDHNLSGEDIVTEDVAGVGEESLVGMLEVTDESTSEDENIAKKRLGQDFKVNL